MSKLYSLQVEKHSLAGLMRNPEVFADVDRFVSDKDYYSDTHQTIFNCIKNGILANEKLDKVLLAQKIKNLGISFKSDINIFEYIDSLAFIPVSPEGTIGAFKELAKFRVLRDLSENSDKIKSHIEKNVSEPLEKIISEIDCIYGKPIDLLTNQNAEENLFASLLDMAEERGNNPQNESGFATPFPEFNRLYGGLRKKNLYIIASRAKSGKALEENTPIPTPNGFVLIKNLKVGDEVFSLSGLPTKVVATAKWSNRKLYKTTTWDGESVICDEQHDWSVSEAPNTKLTVISTKKLFLSSRRAYLPASPVPKSSSTENSISFHPYRYYPQVLKFKPCGMGNTVCIEVEDSSHIFLCGKAMIPTHNSTILNHIASEMSKSHKMPVLFLDTEMSTQETQFRTIAAKTGVPLWYVETGNWRKNASMVSKIRNTLKDVSQYNVFHRFIGNKKLEEVISIARRWRLKHAGRDGNCMIVFDYIKAIDKLTGNQQEYQLMGDKVDAIKKLSEELDCPILTAVQNNRSGITTNKSVTDIVDDESSVGISDRITWYATGVWILRRRVEEEIVLDTPESGTHKLIETVCRYQGRDAAGHQDLIRRTFPDGKTKYVKNFINIDIQNFNVEERGSLRDTIARQNAVFQIEDPNGRNRAESETI